MLDYFRQYPHQIWEWFILILILAGSVYAALAIKNEKRSYLQNIIEYDFKHFTFSLPHWWAVKNATKNSFAVARADTNYDWFATFEWTGQTLEPQLQIKNLLAEKKILIDLATEIEHTSASLSKSFLNLDTENEKPQFKFARVEGTGTQDDEHRIYFDLLVIQDLEKNGSLVCFSRSSILNGCVEGPYFEEVISRIKIKLSSFD